MLFWVFLRNDMSCNAPIVGSLSRFGFALEADQISRCAISLRRAEDLSVYVDDESSI